MRSFFAVLFFELMIGRVWDRIREYVELSEEEDLLDDLKDKLVVSVEVLSVVKERCLDG